jgi:hypothetical protein
MTMTIWGVYFEGSSRGAYVIAPTCKAAKEAFQEVFPAKDDCGYYVRVGLELLKAIHVRNVSAADYPETAVLLSGDPRLAALGLSYKGESE